MGLFDDTSLIKYTFTGRQCVRYGFDYGSDVWFDDPALFAKSPMVEGPTFRDAGGVQEGDYSFTAAFDTVQQRDSFRAQLGKIGTLTKSNGGSRTCCLIRARPVMLYGGIPGLDVTFS